MREEPRKSENSIKFLHRERQEIGRRMYRQGDAVSSRDEIFATLSVENYEIGRKRKVTDFSTFFKFLMFRNFMLAEVIAFDIFISQMGKSWLTLCSYFLPAEELPKRELFLPCCLFLPL